MVGPAPLTLSAERVAEAGYRGLMRGRRVVIPGLGNKLVASLVRVLPRGLVMAGASLRLRRR